ncbi:hypothetical protein ACFQV2_06965 [Actinokineospora soli]|uniref:Uncharacterized protein n=1 Tax=Actinokineospora soli TaxID=1048753 RepID=A0ABW2TIP3_9PSEU
MGVARRAFLIGGAGVALAGAGVLADVLPGGPPLGWTGPDGTVPATPEGPVTADVEWSEARGRDVGLVVRPRARTGRCRCAWRCTAGAAPAGRSPTWGWPAS